MYRHRNKAKGCSENVSCNNRATNGTTISNPYYMKEDISFQEKLNRAKNVRFCKPPTKRHDPPCNKLSNTIPPKPKKDISKPEDTSTYLDITDLKQLQALSSRLNKSQNSNMTKDERSNWYATRGYTKSANGVLVPPQPSPQPDSDPEKETIMQSNVNSMVQRKTSAKYFVDFDSSSSSNTSDYSDDEEESESESQFESQSEEEEEEEEEEGEEYIPNDEMQILYPARMEMMFFCSNFQGGNEIMDMECYMNYGDELGGGDSAVDSDEDVRSSVYNSSEEYNSIGLEQTNTETKSPYPKLLLNEKRINSANTTKQIRTETFANRQNNSNKSGSDMRIANNDEVLQKNDNARRSQTLNSKEIQQPLNARTISHTPKETAPLLGKCDTEVSDSDSCTEYESEDECNAEEKHENKDNLSNIMCLSGKTKALHLRQPMKLNRR